MSWALLKGYLRKLAFAPKLGIGPIADTQKLQPKMWEGLKLKLWNLNAFERSLIKTWWKLENVPQKHLDRAEIVLDW